MITGDIVKHFSSLLNRAILVEFGEDGLGCFDVITQDSFGFRRYRFRVSQPDGDLYYLEFYSESLGGQIRYVTTRGNLGDWRHYHECLELIFQCYPDLAF